MGIHGLTTFIDRNPHVLHTHELKNCSVIIDGNNFYHYLYYACHVNCSLGGDYDVYRKKIISTFKAFEKCGIHPYVILDGAYTVDDRKLKTSLYRASMRNTLVGVMARFGRGQVLPVLAYDTFIQVLSELGVHHVTCQFEADREIAVLANKLRCPVISNDSDFYIFDLIEGFLPLDYIDFRPLCRDESKDSGSVEWFLHSQIYHVDDFINAFEGLSRPMLPVFACLLGNDFVKASSFDSFYSRIQVPKVVSKKYDLPPRLSKIVSVIHWFHIHNKDWSVLLQEILSFLQPQNQGNLRRLFLMSTNVYANIDKFEGCDLYAYFTEKSSDFIPVAGQTFNGYNGSHFPKWFLNSVCRGEITPSTLNAAVLRRVIMLSQVEDLSKVTSYQCSVNIRKVLYGILFKGDPVDVKNHSCHTDGDDEKAIVEHLSPLLKSQLAHASADEGLMENSADIQDHKVDEEGEEEVEDEHEVEVAVLLSKESQVKRIKKQTQLEEYNRVRKHIERFYVDPVIQSNGISLPSLSDIAELPVENRFCILLSALDVDLSFCDKFSSDICLFSSCILIWIRNADPKISEQHVNCVILCLIYLSIYDKLSCKLYKSEEMDGEFDGRNLYSSNHENVKSVNEKPTKINLSQAWRSIPNDQLQKVHQNLTKFHKNAPTFNNKNHFEPCTVHAFSQLQACMLDSSNLNKLLQFPLPKLRPALLYNGTFLYNMYNDLVSRPKPDLYIGTLLISESYVHRIFLDFKSILQECLPQHVYGGPPPKHPKRSRKRSAKINSSNIKLLQNDDDDVHDDENDENKEITAIPGFDVCNKFSFLLSLDT